MCFLKAHFDERNRLILDPPPRWQRHSTDKLRHVVRALVKPSNFVDKLINYENDTSIVLMSSKNRLHNLLNKR